MDIVLDSNIYRNDIPLKSKEFDILLDYLEKTSSYIIIPQIILDEIIGLYERLMTERINDLNKSSNKINNLILNKEKHIPNFAFNTDDEIRKYESHVKQRLRIQDMSIIPYNNDFLPEISQRAINRQKPAGINGQGFRDVLIWLTIKEYAERTLENQIVFISDNCGDFANKDNTDLHDSLQEECNLIGIKINYFKSLKDFIESHSTKINFINKPWLRKFIDYKDILKLLNSDLQERESIAAWFQNKSGNHCTGYYKAISIHPLDDFDFSVYEMIDNSHVINVTVRCEVEMEFEYYKEDHGKRIDFDTYDLDRDRTISIMTDKLEFEIYFSMTIRNDTLLETEISDWSF